MADYTFSSTYWNQNDQANMGPFYDSTSGDYYVVLQNQVSTFDVEMWRSTDDGDTYSEQDASNAPTPGGTSQSYWGNGATGVYVSGTRRIYVFYWVMTSTTEYTLRATYFNIATNAWHTSTWDSSTACHTDANTNNHGIDVEYKSSTEIGVYYMGADESVKGSPYERMNYETFNPSTNAWSGSPIEIPTGVSYDARGGGMTFDSSGDVICTVNYYEASGSQLHIFKLASGSYTDHGQSGNATSFNGVDDHPSSVYSGLTTEEFAIAYRTIGSPDVLRYDYSTSPTSTPWTSTSIDTDDNWVETREAGASICYVGTKRYLFAMKEGTTNSEVHCWTKDGTGSWTEVGVIYEHSANVTPQELRVNHLKTDTNEFFGFVYDAGIGASYEYTAVIWEEGGAQTRSKTASVDAKVSPPEGVLPNVTLPEVVLGDVSLLNDTVSSEHYIVAVAKDNAKELVLLLNNSRGMQGDWIEVDSMHTFAQDIKSLHVNREFNQQTYGNAITVQLANGDVYWGVYTMGPTSTLGEWTRDTHQFSNGPLLTPRLVASPGTPDEFAAVSCGDYLDTSNEDPRTWVFYHQKVSTKNKIMWASSKHDEYHGEYNTVGGSYFTDGQRLDPDSTDDEYLGAASCGVPPTTDGTSTATGWQSLFGHVLYTRVGASTTSAVKRQVWPSTIFAMYTDATGGTFDLTWNNHTDGVDSIQTVTSINYNSSAATIKSKLEGATGVDTVNVTGAGTKASPWIVDFDTYSGTIQPSTPYTHSPPNQCVAYFEPDSTNLTSGTAYVAVPVVETVVGTVKHNSRIRGQWKQRYTPSWQGTGQTQTHDRTDRVYIAHIGTDSKPMIIRTPEYGGTWDWQNQWVLDVFESAIGSKNVKSDANGYPQLTLDMFSDYGAKQNDPGGYDISEHWVIMMIEDTTDDVILQRRRLRDYEGATYDPL